MNCTKTIILIFYLTAIFIVVPSSLLAFTAYDYETNDYVEIDGELSSIQGKDIEMYDHNDNSYHGIRVISVTENDSVEIDVYDYTVEDYRTFEVEEDYPDSVTAQAITRART